jgi:threonine/homoserine/homoserine lactone efflux protein
MFMWQIVLYGFTFGMGAAAFPGPINLEVVRRAISRGPKVAIAFGMGAVTADIIYISAISTGAAALLSTLPVWGQAVMYVVGAGLLLVIGTRAIKVKVPLSSETGEQLPGEDVVPEIATRARAILRGFLLGLILTLGSPPTVFYWILVSVTAAQHFSQGYELALLLSVGVFTACTLWVVGVSLIIGRFHRRLNPKVVLLVERVVGGALIFLAFYSVLKAVLLYIH